jgi:hypothetical protein
VVGAGIGCADGAGVGEADGAGVGAGASVVGSGFVAGFASVLTTTPLFQISLFPLFMHVNFFSAFIAVLPALAHFAPTLTAAFEGATTKVVKNNAAEITTARPIRKRVMTTAYIDLDWLRRTFPRVDKD